MLVEVGSSATITSLTNMLAFGIGIFSPLPEIQLFSAANAITMLFDFIYQITFFAAIFSIGGRYELENELKQIEKSLRKTEIALSNHAEKASNVKINPKKKSNNDNDKSDNGVLTKVRTLFARMVRDQNDDINEKKTNEKEKKVVIISGVGREIGDNTDSGTSTVSIGSDANSERIAKVMRNALILGYCQWISNRFTLMLNIILLILYWTFCILNAVKAKAGLTPQKLFLSDSQTIKALGIRDNYVFNVHSPVWIYVNNVGNLSDPQIRQRHYEMIESFELLPECNGKPFTKFWLRAYEDYLAASDSAPDEESVNEDLESTISQSYTTDRIIQFMEWPETKFWGSFIRLTDDRKRIRAYSAMVVFHGEKLYLWPEKYKLLLKWRQIANNFSDLSASVFDENSQYMDQIDSLIPLVINNSVLTLFSMAFVCFLFMNDTRMVVFASVTVTSIFIGVFGILTFLGIDVDPLSMSVMILTIGLSVDYPAHIVYHFCRFRDRGECKNVAEVMERTFISVGYPVLQCSFSALLFVTCVFFVDSYMSMILWRVMSLVVLLGLYHTLFVIPCFLCAKQIQQSSGCFAFYSCSGFPLSGTLNRSAIRREYRPRMHQRNK
ncbi:hypothetical protein AB6A40_007050 [Gnathostoma spinigerum]|uniref:SSD domain-containing protein n=1 Tax=Gnathostoma spinigerum TaxID=75299 RepID=A0ABD6EM46_9BILA